MTDSVEEKRKSVLVTPILRLGFLIALNVLLHTLVIGSGVFNTEIQENYPNSFLSGIILYTLILPLPVIIVLITKAAFRRLNRTDSAINILSWLQSLFVLIHMMLLITESL